MDETPSGNSETRLAPLPRRVGDLDPIPMSPTRSAEAIVDEMLERASVLFKTLEADVAGLEADQARERERITRQTERLRAEADTAVEILAELTTRALDIERRKGREGVIDAALRGPAPSIDNVTFDRLAESIGEEIRLAKGITGAIRIDAIGQMLRSATAWVEKMIADADASNALLMAETDQTLSTETVEATASFEIGAGVLERDLATLEGSLPASALAWNDPGWITWEPPVQPTGCIRLGNYRDPRLQGLELPVLYDIPGPRGIVIEPGRNTTSNAVSDVLKSILLRIVAAFPPGAARFTVFDPDGLGDSIGPLLGFAEAAPVVLDGGVHTTVESINAALTELSAHMEQVIQRYLRGQFSTLAEADAEAGEMLEPYHFVVIMNHPLHLDEPALERLSMLFGQGPRCGVYPIVVRDPTYTPVYGGPKVPPLEPAFTINASATGFEVTAPAAGVWPITLDHLPDRRASERLVVTTADQAIHSHQTSFDPARAFAMLQRAVEVGLRKDIPDLPVAIDTADSGSWWSAPTTRGVGVPIGRSGAVDVASLWFDNARAGNCVLVGGSDNDLDQLLEWVTLGLTIPYSPENLQLDLVGLGQRRAFAPFGDHALPHATVVSMDAEVELAASVLDSLARELDRRIRDESDTRSVPRRILILDDLEQLTRSSRGTDSTSTSKRLERAMDHLERIISEGPGVGIHSIVVLRSADTHTLRTLDSVTTRIILEGTDSDIAAALGADVDELDHLSTGEALMVNGPAVRATTRRIRLVGIDSGERDRLLREQRSLATRNRITTRPQVFNGRAVAKFEQTPLTQLFLNVRKREERLLPRLWLGEPMELGGPTEVLLRRNDGSNLLVVGPHEDLAQGLLVAAATTAVMGHGRNLDIRIIDLMSLESGFTESIRALSEHWPVALERRRNLHKVIDQVHNVVVDRGSAALYQEPPLLLMINGLGRAREFDDESNRDLIAMLESIVTSGPEVGVHTLIWAETSEVLNNRLNTSITGQFGLRVAMGLNSEASVSLIDSPAAADLAGNQAILYDEATGRLTRFRPYALPDPEWLAGLSRAAAGAL